MKLALFFFLCFSFLLLSGSSHSRLPVSLQGGHTVLKTLPESRQQYQTFFHSKNTTIHSTDNSSSEYNFSNAVEPEDNDDDHKLPVRVLEWNTTFFHLFHMQLSGNRDCYCKACILACSHIAFQASDKYITYRAIRI